MIQIGRAIFTALRAASLAKTARGAARSIANNFSFTVTFEDTFRSDAFSRLPAEIQEAFARAAYAEALNVMERSKRICPVDTGALRASGLVYEPDIQPVGINVTLGYGGPAIEYAIYVHENLGAKHAPPTQAKFLEAPLREAERGLVDRVAARVRQDLFDKE